MTKKIEILFDVALCGETIEEDDFVDYLETVSDVVKANPDSNKTVIDIEGEFGDTITHFCIYRKPVGMGYVSERAIRFAIREANTQPAVDGDNETQAEELLGKLYHGV